MKITVYISFAISLEINMRPWPVFGMYQPDSIHVMSHGGKEYLVTANEGDAKDYSDYVPNGFNEEIRVKHLDIQGIICKYTVYTDCCVGRWVP